MRDIGPGDEMVIASEAKQSLSNGPEGDCLAKSARNDVSGESASVTCVLDALDPAALVRAVAILRDGGLVCHPTDTVYGVAASALLPEAVARLYVVKERPRDKAIPLLLGDAGAVDEIARDVPDLAYRMMERFWPGGLTIVLWAQAHVPAIVTAGTGSVAVRLPDHATPRALARALGAPLAATSANLSGRPSPRTAQDVLADLGGRVELILDGGPCPGGVDSTVVDLTKDPPVIARAGAISADALAPILFHRKERRERKR